MCFCLIRGGGGDRGRAPRPPRARPRVAAAPGADSRPAGSSTTNARRAAEGVVLPAVAVPGQEADPARAAARAPRVEAHERGVAAAASRPAAVLVVPDRDVAG